MTKITPPSRAPDTSGTDSEPEANMNGQSNTTRHIENLDWVIEAFKTPWPSIQRLSTYLMVDLGGYKIFASTARWLIENPLYTLLLFIVFLLSLPFLMLLGFGISVFAMSVTGFIVLEGTLLTFASIISFGCLGVLLIVLTFLSVTFVAVYMGFAHIYDLYGGTKESTLNTFRNQENAHTSDNRTKKHRRKNSGSQKSSNIESIGPVPQ